MVKSTKKRREKYEAKIDGSVIGGRYDATKDLSIRKQRAYFGDAVKLENQVKVLVDGEPSMLHHFYIAFAEELIKKGTAEERDITYVKWLSRGLSFQKLCEIAEAIAGGLVAELRRYEHYYQPNNWLLIQLPEGQTFTIGTTGRNERFELDHIKLRLRRNADPDDTVTFSLYNTDAAGKPAGAAIATKVHAWNDLPAAVAWFDVIFAGTIILEAGIKYAIVMSASDYTTNLFMYQVKKEWGDPMYDGGNEVFFPGPGWSERLDWDYVFEVWGTGPLCE